MNRLEVDPLTGHRILVTGGAGFIGSHLVETLAEENEVYILDTLSGENEEDVDDRAELVVGDIRDESIVREAMKGIDIVFHEAALVSVTESVDHPYESHTVNVGGTLNILEAARRTGARVVIASSAAIYGHPRDLPIEESDQANPTSPYGLEKLSVDEYARLYHELYGLETVALRYFNVYGPRQAGGDYAGVINVFLEQAQQGKPITINGDGKQTRDFVYVSDIVQANIAAARTDAIGRSFNVGTGTSVTIRELAETVRKVTNSDSEITHCDPRPGDIEHSRADISAARSDLGYKPTVTLEEGLSQLCHTLFHVQN